MFVDGQRAGSMSVAINVIRVDSNDADISALIDAIRGSVAEEAQKQPRKAIGFKAGDE